MATWGARVDAKAAYTGWSYDREHGVKLWVVNGVPIFFQRLHDDE